MPRLDEGRQAERQPYPGPLPICHEDEAVISGWEETLWADGPMEPLLMTDD